jgi:hypothetical protein
MRLGRHPGIAPTLQRYPAGRRDPDNVDAVRWIRRGGKTERSLAMAYSLRTTAFALEYSPSTFADFWTPAMSPIDFNGKALDSMVAAHPDPLEIGIPPVLQASVERHQANLVRLLQSFRAAGMEEAQIEAAVTVVIESYKHELLQAIRTLTASERTGEDTR